MISLSIFFSSDKVYCGVFERTNKGLSLINLVSTLDPIDLDDIESASSTKAINQLNRELKQLETNVSELNVIVANEYSFWTIMPGSLDTTDEELKQLLELEIRNNVKSFNLNDFSFRVYPYGLKDEDENDQLFVSYFRKEIISNCNTILNIVGLEPNYIASSQISSQNTIEYNYPDSSHLYSLLINKEDQFCDVTVSNDKRTFYYNLLKSETDELLIDNIIELISEVQDSGISPGNLLLSGSKLTKVFIDKLNNATSSEFTRINSFRLIRANVDNRMRDYCVRTSHLYAPVVGGSLKSFDNGKIIEF